jgi:Cu2+-exporting ATPase
MDDHIDHHRQMARQFRRKFFISLGLTVPVLLLSEPFFNLLGVTPLSFSGSFAVQTLFATAIFLYGGWPFLSGLYSEMSENKPGMMTLVAVALTMAYGYSLAVFIGLSGSPIFWEVATLVDVMLLGHWLEMRSVIRASRALEKLTKLLPSTAHKVDGDTLLDIPVSELEHGDKVRVKAGERVPADGTILEGESTLEESMLTGESQPVSKRQGNSVIAGSVNGEGVLTVTVQETGEATYLSQIITLVENAQQSASGTQRLADRVAFWLTIIALTAGLITFLVWDEWTGESLPFVIQRTTAVIVIACPHALGLAIPLVTSISTSLSAQNGILIRDRAAFEQAYRTRAAVFDKTGTLTYGNFHVSHIQPLHEKYTREAVIHYAASLETHSEHPIGQAIANETEKVSPVSSVQTLPGKGLEGTLNNHTVRVVSPGYLEENTISIDKEKPGEGETDGRTITYVLLENTPIGRITLEDEIRPEAKEAVQTLQDRNIEVVMLTGDQAAVANRVAGELNISTVLAEVLPDTKNAEIKELQEKHGHVTMVGDGLNDAPALAQANMGVAIGEGTDIAAETADVILVHNDPRDVARLLKLSQKTWHKMIQNLWWAAGYNIIAIPLAAGAAFSVGLVLSPAVGALLMSLSTIIVAFNAMLLPASTGLKQG